MSLIDKLTEEDLAGMLAEAYKQGLKDGRSEQRQVTYPYTIPYVIPTGNFTYTVTNTAQ